MQKKFVKYITGIFIVIILLLPIGALFWGLGEPSPAWVNIRDFVLFQTIVNTGLLVFFTALFTGIAGSFSAVFISLYNFKFKRLFSVLLILPLAIPPYIAGFLYVDFLSFTGPLQSFLRTYTSLDIRHFSIMNLPGAIFIFTFTLYPYVYLITRAYLKNNSLSFVENGRLLSKNTLQLLFKIVLPLLGPAILTGLTMVSLEVVNDFGVANYFGVRTLSTLIFQAWHNMFDVYLAIRISFVLIGFVAAYFFISRLFFRDQKYRIVSAKEKPLKPIYIKGIRAGILICFFTIITGLGFFIPFIYMITMLTETNWTLVVQLSLNTIAIVAISTIIIMLSGLYIANLGRKAPKKIKGVLRLANIGYGLPSPVLAIGIIALFAGLNNFIPINFGFTLVMLVFAYVVKYFAPGHFNLEKGYSKVGHVYTDSSLLLGRSSAATFFKVDIFTIKNAVFSGSVLIFIDLIKELPLTLILRSFNFQTLATRTYMFAMNEQLPQAAPFSLVIVLICGSFLVVMNLLEK